MSKKLYIYKRVDRCAPSEGHGVYHEEGGLVVVTSGYPNDAVPSGVGDRYTVGRGDDVVEKFGLPEPDLVFTVPDDSPDVVVVFPDAGCC